MQGHRHGRSGAEVKEGLGKIDLGANRTHNPVSQQCTLAEAIAPKSFLESLVTLVISSSI